MRYGWKQALFKLLSHGSMVYALGDSVAALILNEFSAMRFLGMMLVGATFYTWEIPRYFEWIDRKVKAGASVSGSLKRITLAMLYFNPLWIARHLAFIMIFTGRFHEIGLSTLKLGTISWIGNIPVAIIGNYIIQVKLPLKYRFLGSSVFSSILAVYYALSETLFT